MRPFLTFMLYLWSSVLSLGCIPAAIYLLTQYKWYQVLPVLFVLMNIFAFLAWRGLVMNVDHARFMP